jgi:hypothetical protein
MSTVQPFPAGGYRFIAHQFQYSGGVAAEPGFRIERARFTRPVPLAEGFDAIEAYLGGVGRSPTAFCACELRSPAQFTDAGFVAFNRHYVERLAAWGIFRDEINPVARSNVCPEIDPPATPSFFAFSYTVPSESRTARSFVAAGSGEAREGGPSYEGRIIRRGDQSPEAMCEKARFVLGAMELAHGGARLRLGGRDGDPSLYDLRYPSALGRRDCPPRSHPRRFDLAFCAPAGAGPRFRDGRTRIRDLTRYSRHEKL